MKQDQSFINTEKREQCFCIKLDDDRDKNNKKKLSSSNEALKSIQHPNYGTNTRNKLCDVEEGDVLFKKHPQDDGNSISSDRETISVASIIGSFGWFQLLVLIFSGMRECAVAYDALITSILLQPESNYTCLTHSQSIGDEDPGLTVKINSHFGSHGYFSFDNNSSSQSPLTAPQCFADNDPSNQNEPCSEWLFSNRDQINNRASLVVEWSLVCHRSWYMAFIESSFFLGLVVGNLLWGFLADRIGRKKAYIISHSLALITGSIAIVMPNVQLFAISRFLSALGSIGYNILYTIQMELIGIKHRPYGTMFNHLGWGLGAICIPLIASLTNNSQLLLLVTPIITLIMFPLAFWLPESSRWLMAHGKFSSARKELIRAAKFNGKLIDRTIENSISLLNDKICGNKAGLQQMGQEKSLPLYLQTSQKEDFKKGGDSNQKSAIVAIGETCHYRVDYLTTSQQHQQQQQQKQQQQHLSLAIDDLDRKSSINSTNTSNLSSYRILFSNSILVRDTIIISYTSFVGHLFYYLQTINFGYMKNLSIEANFISSGAGEWFSLIVGAIMIKFLCRKTCMSIFLMIMSLSFIFQSLIDSGLFPELNTPVIVTFNNTIGTLSSLLLVFVVLIVNQEVYPTIIRQTGSSIGNTLGELGSTLAPWLIQLNARFGPWRADLLCSLMCSFGMIGAFFVTKTDNIELVDV